MMVLEDIFLYKIEKYGKIIIELLLYVLVENSCVFGLVLFKYDYTYNKLAEDINLDVNKLYAEAFIDGANPEIGQSRPVVIYADGEKYLLKNNIVQGEFQDATFFQEILCCFLARKLDIPIPPFAIIELDTEFLDNNPVLRFTHKFKEGIFFATKIIDDVENNLVDNYILSRQAGQPRINYSWNVFFKGISNQEAIASIVAFDILTLNFDRFGNEGNILVAKNNEGQRMIYAIDHGHAFCTPFYKKVELEKINLFEENMNFSKFMPHYFAILKNNSGNPFNLGPIFSGLEQNISFERNPFLGVVEKIESLSQGDIIDMLESIPPEWVSGGAIQKNHYLGFIMRQKDLVRKFLDVMAESDVFSNHKGGKLLWTMEEQSYGMA